MSRKTLTERFVQNTVAARLHREHYRRKDAYVATEAYTKLKRADVFLAFMRAANRPYVVVVEAKSRTTIHQLKLKEDPDKLRWTGWIVAIILIAGLSAALGYQWYFNAVNTALLLGLFLLGSTLLTALARRLDLSLHKSVGVIEQLARYPANEQWIAVGEDTFAKPAEYRTLRRQCRKNGLGLIVVTARGKLRLKEIPTPRHTFNNYLDRYGKEATIRKHIERRPDYGATPAERAKTRRQLLNAGVLLGIVGLLGLIGYEERYRPVVPDPFTEDGWVADTLTVPEVPVSLLDCGGFVIEKRSFIVVDDLLKEEKARLRLGELVANNFSEARMVPTECLNSWPAGGRQAVWLGEVWSDRPAARAALERYRERLARTGMEAPRARVVKVRP
ncbi:MAG: hypothetical protein AAFZ52_15880 [Bacteroidota bacterium]